MIKKGRSFLVFGDLLAKKGKGLDGLLHSQLQLGSCGPYVPGSGGPLAFTVFTQAAELHPLQRLFVFALMIRSCLTVTNFLTFFGFLSDVRGFLSSSSSSVRSELTSCSPSLSLCTFSSTVISLLLLFLPCFSEEEDDEDDDEEDFAAKGIEVGALCRASRAVLFVVGSVASLVSVVSSSAKSLRLRF